MTGERPWWASDEAPGSHRGDDPVVAFRAARRGGAPSVDVVDGQHEPAAGDVSDADAAEVPEPDTAEVHDVAAAAGRDAEAAACGVCPWCTTVRVLAQHHPELLGHLREAGRHLGAAGRAVLDATLVAPADREPERGYPAPSADRGAPGAAPEPVTTADPPVPVAPADGRLHRIALGHDDHR